MCPKHAFLAQDAQKGKVRKNFGGSTLSQAQIFLKVSRSANLRASTRVSVAGLSPISSATFLTPRPPLRSLGSAPRRRTDRALAGTGYPWKIGDGFNLDGARSHCEQDNPLGCEQDGLIIYASAGKGFCRMTHVC